MNTSIEALLAISLTMGIYLAAEKIYVRLKRNALVHPVVISIFSLMGILALFGWDYASYQQDTYVISFLLGPATVALAIPLYEQMALIKQMALPLMITCLVGAIVAAASAMLLSAVWTGDEIISLSMISKSVTTPIGMDITRVVGGSPSLAAGIIMFAGMLGSLFVPYITRFLGVKSDAIHGFVVGVTAHGFGTAQAFERSVQAGAFAGLAMSLTGIASAFILPVTPLADWVIQLTQ
jgi:predicted murein hydrolase (TIGR00659 family)